MTPEEYRAKMEELVPHYYCEDSWYSCPLAEDGCADDTQIECKCGREEKILALTQLFVEGVKSKKPMKESEISFGEQSATATKFFAGLHKGFNTGIDQFESNLLALFKGGEK